MKLAQLSLRDLFWLVLVAACLSGWGVERSRLIREIDALRSNGPLYTIDLAAIPEPADEPMYMRRGRTR